MHEHKGAFQPSLSVDRTYLANPLIYVINMPVYLFYANILIYSFIGISGMSDYIKNLLL